MTEPTNRRQQPEQARTAVATVEPPGEVNAQTRALERRKAQIAQVAQTVQGASRDLDRLLPEHINLPTFLAGVGAALHKSQDLMDGAIQDPDALLIALRESAMLGHVPGTPHYWLTPRKAKSKPSVLGIEGYEGIVDRMFRSGGVLSAHVGVVRANDIFDPYGGIAGRPLHKPAGGWFGKRADRGEVIGSFAYAMLLGGVPSEVIMLSMEDLMEIKAFAATPKFWNLYPIQMYKKSALRRLEPLVPVTAGYRQSLAQAQTFVAATAGQPLRMEDTPSPAGADDTDQVVEGDVEDGPKQHREAIESGDAPDAGKPEPVAYNPADWTNDPAWSGLSVARPGEGIPERGGDGG